MTYEEKKKIFTEFKDLYGPYKMFPLYFVQYPEINKMVDTMPILIEELEKAWAALEFYARHQNHQHTVETMSDFTKVEEDGGKRARGALND